MAMHPFGEVWRFTRTRLSSALDSMSERTAQFRAFASGHNTIEYCLHIAAAEHYWAHRLGSCPESARGTLLERCLFEGFLHDGSFPAEFAEFNLKQAVGELDWTMSLIQPVFDSPTESQVSMELTSPIGDAVLGREGLMRLAQHAAYHTGQIVLLGQVMGESETPASRRKPGISSV